MSNDAVTNVVPLRAPDRTGPSNAAQFERLLKECRDLACQRLSQSLAGMLDKADDTLWGLSNATQEREAQKLYAEAKDKLLPQAQGRRGAVPQPLSRGVRQPHQPREQARGKLLGLRWRGPRAWPGRGGRSQRDPQGQRHGGKTATLLRGRACRSRPAHGCAARGCQSASRREPVQPAGHLRRLQADLPRHRVGCQSADGVCQTLR